MERLYQDVNSNGKNFEDEQNFTPSTANIRSAYYRAQQLMPDDEHQQQLLLLPVFKWYVPLRQNGIKMYHSFYTIDFSNVFT